MIDVMIAKLEQFTALTEEDRQVLRAAVREVVEFQRGEDIIREGDRPDAVHLLLEGWAGRCKITDNGDRHIMAFLIPGDLCDVHVTLLDVMDHGIEALSHCRVAFFAKDSLAAIMTENRRLGPALLWATLVDEAILREWLVNLGGRQADKRLAHLFCEMLFRCRAVGLASDGAFHVPLTQQQLAESLGITSIHMNRTLKDLRARQLIRMSGSKVTINDLEALMDFAGFDATYLHQARGPASEAPPLAR